MKIYKYDNTNNCNVAGSKIKTLRVQRHLSQEAFAAQLQLNGLNLNQKAISRIENGLRVIADYELCYIANFFNISTDELTEDFCL